MFWRKDSRMSKHASATISKKDIIVAVRMPKGLVLELRDIQKINHFMDMSDEIRYIVRKYGMQSPIGQLPQKDIGNAFLESKRKEKLIEELNKIISQLQVGKEGGTE